MSLDNKHPEFKKFSNMFQDYWKLFKKFFNPVIGNEIQEDAWWDELIKQVGDFSRKYDNDPFARALSIVLTEEMERKYKESKKLERDNICSKKPS